MKPKNSGSKKLIYISNSKFVLGDITTPGSTNIQLSRVKVNCVATEGNGIALTLQKKKEKRIVGTGSCKSAYNQTLESSSPSLNDSELL